MKTIFGVSIGDFFKYNKNQICEVIDFLECKSLEKDEIVKHICIVRGINSLAKNSFEIPFATVIRNRINKPFKL